MNKTFITLSLALLFSFEIYGQLFNINGTIKDSATLKTIENVIAEARTLNSQSDEISDAITDSKGHFSISLPKGVYIITLKVLGYNAYSEEIVVNSDIEREFTLTSQPIPLGEVEVSSFRVNRMVKELPIPVAVVGSYDYQRLSSTTLSNVLALEPGIAIGGDGVWATNINIRGMGESRLVSLIDGNRIETATDLTASLSMIDVNDIERVEIIKGAQSSLYGTGAMGGIVNIITRDGHFSDKPFVSANASSGYATANKLITAHADVTTGSSAWYMRISGSHADADDMMTPEGILPNSQFRSNNFAVKAGLKPFNNQVLKVQYQNNWSKDVGIPGGDAFPGPAEATYTDISRQLLSASYEVEEISEILRSLKISYFRQYIARDVAMTPNTSTTTLLPSGSQVTTPELITPIGNHLTNGGQIQATWALGNNNTIIAGADIWSRKLTTERTKYITVDIYNTDGDITKTNEIVRGETPIPESSFTSAGLYFQNETALADGKLRLITGGRIDGISVKNKEGYDVDYLIINGTRNDTPPNQRITFEEGNEKSVSWSANTGILYKIKANTDISFNVARSFRAPSLEERFKYIDLGNYVRLGNPALEPESGYSADLGVRVWEKRFTLKADIFANRIYNMIVEEPGEFIYTINTGVSEGETDTLPALVNSNVSKALLYGADIELQYNIYSGFVVYGSCAYVRGTDTEKETNLPQIPPFTGRVGLRYSNSRLGSAEIAVIGAAKQDKVADGESTTGGYTRLDMSVNTTKVNLGPVRLQFFAGIDNITDRKYTNHLATNRGSISVEPGRNIYFRINLVF